MAVKWFVAGAWARQEDHQEAALSLLRASVEGTVSLLQPPRFLAEVAAVLARKKPGAALRDAGRLAALDIAWAEPTRAWARAVDLACRLDHHLFDTLYHALALDEPGDVVLVTADRRYFDKARHLGRIAWLPDFTAA